MNGSLVPHFYSFKGKRMKSILLKSAAVTAILLVSAGAYAANMDCCGDIACCLKMLTAACCP
jgi:hypothetical protein